MDLSFILNELGEERDLYYNPAGTSNQQLRFPYRC